MLTREWSDWRNGDWWWIQSVYVPDAHRRQGVFAALYRHVEQLARDTPGVVGLRLYVERDNANAQRTYEALGMRDAGYRIFETRVRGASYATRGHRVSHCGADRSGCDPLPARSQSNALR